MCIKDKFSQFLLVYGTLIGRVDVTDILTVTLIKIIYWFIVTILQISYYIYIQYLTKKMNRFY